MVEGIGKEIQIAFTQYKWGRLKLIIEVLKFPIGFHKMMGVNMGTSYDPFEKHRELIEYLMLGHMSSFSINTHLTSILGYSETLLTETMGALNDDQKHFLSGIGRNTHYLHKHLNTFITASRLIFRPQRTYISKFNIYESIERFTNQIAKDKAFQIENDFPENQGEVEGDASLIDYAIDNILGVVAQIHPDRKGDIKITVSEDEKLLKITVSTNKDRIIDFEDENVELFIIQSVAELHSGSFEINSNESMCNITFTIPMKQE